VDTFFEIENGMVIIYNNYVVVGYSILCSGLYMIDLMRSLSHFSSSAYFVNTVVVSKCSRNIETSYMLWYRRLDHFSRSRIERLIYGLKQASRQWFFKFDGIVISCGFKENYVDQCIYT
jgi:hypothetical protein